MRNPVKRLYHFDSVIERCGMTLVFKKFSQYGYYSCFLLPFLSFHSLYASFNSAQSDHKPMCKQALKHLPKIFQPTNLFQNFNEKKKMSSGWALRLDVVVVFFLFQPCVYYSPLSIVWVDLDNSNKLNGMQSLESPRDTILFIIFKLFWIFLLREIKKKRVYGCDFSFRFQRSRALSCGHLWFGLLASFRISSQSQCIWISIFSLFLPSKVRYILIKL